MDTDFIGVWLNFWTQVNDSGSNEQVGYYLGIYTALQVMGAIWFANLTG